MGTNKKCCLTCRYARKACAGEQYVGCVKYNLDGDASSEIALDSYIVMHQGKLFDKKDAVIGTGWVYTGAYPGANNHNIMGIMTNGILVVQKDNVCEQYEKHM